MLRFACIVEGQGDAEAVPGLVRRIAWSFFPAIELHSEAFRFPRNQLLRPGVLESKIELVVRRIGRQGAVLVILDADDDYPARLGPALLERARRARPDLALGVVLAKREFEAWFLAAAESLRGWRGLPETLEAPGDPEAIRGAKEWLGRSSGLLGRATRRRPISKLSFGFSTLTWRGKGQRLSRSAGERFGGFSTRSGGMDGLPLEGISRRCR